MNPISFGNRRLNREDARVWRCSCGAWRYAQKPCGCGDTGHSSAACGQKESDGCVCNADSMKPIERWAG